MSYAGEGVILMSITVRFSKEEEEMLRNIVEAKDTNISVYIREVINEKIEEEIDKELYKKAMEIKMDESAEYISWDEALEELGLDDEQ